MPKNLMVFRVNPESEFYQMYFEAQHEKAIFNALAEAFCKKYDIHGACHYTEDLEMRFPNGVPQKHIKDFCVCPLKYKFYRAKRKSSLNQAWREEVAECVNFARLRQCSTWWTPFLSGGRYAMWHFENEIYGLLECAGQVPIEPAGYMMPIELDTYLETVEQAENSCRG